MRSIRLFLRFVRVALVVQLAVLSYWVARIGRAPHSSENGESRFGVHLARLLERLGATYVKLGQILSTRPDILPSGIVSALVKLQDRVEPESYDAIRKVLVGELGEGYEATLGVLDPAPIAAASVAQVHSATRPDGRRVAVKIKRPGIDAQVERDLALMMLGARIVDVIPQVKLLSLPGAIEQFAFAMREQLDFRNEAKNNRRFATNFEDVERVAVPELVDELCTERVLVMEFVIGVRATEPEKVGGDRRALAKAGLEAIVRMVFRDGFVHADMHPGNIMLTHDDRVVLIDLGLVAEIPDEMRRPWIETFVALSMRDGHAAARLLYGHSPRVGTVDYPRFASDVEAEFRKLDGKALGDLEATRVLTDMMSVLRRHRIQIDPVFTVVNLAMLVAEGLGKQLDPEIDVIALSTPYIADAMMTAPPGRPMLREIPEAA